MSSIEFNCLPTIIGSMPHTDPQKACSLITHYLKDIPAWPQLPQRSFLENMYVQYSEGIPGRVLGTAEQEDRLYIDCSRDLTEALTKFYTDYMEKNLKPYHTSPDVAAGFYAFLSLENLRPPVVKGQIAGPLTWGMTVTDENRRAIIYNDTFSDIVPKFLHLKAAWQENELSKLSKNVITFVDEPYMSAFGSVGVMLSQEKIAEMLEEVFAGIKGLKGLHCCGNTDWSVLLKTSLDILSFDAYNYAESVSLYPAEVKKFLDKGGVIAWGIVPNDENSVVKESVSSLKDRLEEAMAPFTRNGVRFRDLISQSLLTPSCGLEPLSEDSATHALELLTELSAMIRKRHI